MTYRTALVAIAGTCVLAAGAHAPLEATQFPRGLMATASPPQGCVIETRPMGFGEYDSAEPQPKDSLAQVIYTCNPVQGGGAVKTVRIHVSRGNAGSFDRAMINGTSRLRYNLYLDATHQQIWGDGSGGTDYYINTNVPNNLPVTVPIYGRIFALQEVPLGAYADTLQVEVLF